MANGDFLVGFGRVDITPSQPVLLQGYYYDRLSTGVHDRLYARTMSVSDGDNRVVLCVVDLVYFAPRKIVDETRRLISDICALPPENVILAATHTHTGPDLGREEQYADALPAMFAESVRLAVEDLSPADLDVARGRETTLQFIRRYKMKDGSVVTNPGIMNPDVVEPIGEVDPDLHVLMACADGEKRGGLTHFGIHCDTVGGAEISADWPCYVQARLMEQFGEDFALLTPMGPAGDINHWNVFKDVSVRGFAETERIGSKIAQAALDAFKDAQPVRSGPVRSGIRRVDFQVRLPTDDELAQARRVMAQPAPEGIDFTMERVEAKRRIRAAEKGPVVTLDITAISFGNVGLVTLPVELFSQLGRNIKSRSPFDYTLPVAPANDNIGYVGERHNHQEGGLEMTSSVVVPGTGEMLVDTAVDLLEELHSS